MQHSRRAANWHCWADHGGYAPKISGVDPKYVWEAMLTGPQAMDKFSNGNLSPEEKRDIIAYLHSLEESPELRRVRSRRHRPGERGHVRLARRHRLAGRRGGLDRGPHGPYVEDEGGAVNDNLPETTGGAHKPATVEEPIPNPGLEPHRVASDRRRPEGREARRAPGRRACSGSRSWPRSCSWSPTSSSRSATTPRHIGGLGASNLALGLTLAVALLAMGAGIIQWARKLMGDHEIVEMPPPRLVLPGRPRGRPSASSRQGSRSRVSGRRPLIRNSLLAAGGILGIVPIVMLRDLGPLPGDKLDHTIWDLNTWTPEMQAWWADAGPHVPARRPRRRRYADQGRRPRGRRPGQRRARGAADRRSDGQPLVEGTQLLVDEGQGRGDPAPDGAERDRVEGRP